MKNKKIYILLLNYNGWKDTIECLESILKSDYDNFQIIVVDNHSVNKSMNKILDWAEGKQEVVYSETTSLKHLSQPAISKPLPYILYSQKEALTVRVREIENKLNNPIVFIQSESNDGFASGNNIGIKYALAKNDFEYIWLLNNDTVIEKDTISRLVKAYSEKSLNQKLGILGTVQMYYDEPKVIQAAAGGFNKLRCHFWNYQHLDFVQNDIAYIYGASMLISKEVFKTVGLLNEEYFMYYEEIDLAERLKLNHYTIDVAKDIIIYHKHGGTTSTLDSDFRTYYLTKNKFVFYKNYYFLYLPFCYMKVLKTNVIYFLKNGKINKAMRDSLFFWKNCYMQKNR